MSTAIEERQAEATAALDVRIVAAWKSSGNLSKVAKRLGLTLSRVRRAVDVHLATEAEVEPKPALRPWRDEVVYHLPARRADEATIEVDEGSGGWLKAPVSDDGIDPSIEAAWLSRFYTPGMTLGDLAAAAGVTPERVMKGLEAAINRELAYHPREKKPPDLRPLFPVGPFTPTSNCAHRVPIVPGSALCCMVCHQSGLDSHPAMKRDEELPPDPPDGVERFGKWWRAGQKYSRHAYKVRRNR